MTGLRVFVAAPFTEGEFVERGVHAMLREIGCQPMSTWARESMRRAGQDGGVTAHEANVQLVANIRDLDVSDVVMVLAREGAGAESYVEMGRALERGKDVVFVGTRFVLSSYAPNVVRFEALPLAIDYLRRRNLSRLQVIEAPR